MVEITQSLLHEMLDYNEDSGVFTWKVRPARRVHVGDVAGTLSKKGYLGFKIFGNYHLAHRLAWLYVYGKEPKDFIDHINRITTDNRICNLREATNQENKRNGKKYRNNTSGFRGVYRKNNGWEAYLVERKKVVYVGRFKTPEEASSAAENVAKKLHGEFYGGHHAKA